MPHSLLDQLDQLVGSVVAPAHASFGAQVLPSPMTATWDEQRAAQGPTYTVSMTKDAERFIRSRRETLDVARATVTTAYFADKKPGALARRDATLAAIRVTIPDRRPAEEAAALAAACAVEHTWAAVIAELRALYPSD